MQFQVNLTAVKNARGGLQGINQAQRLPVANRIANGGAAEFSKILDKAAQQGKAAGLKISKHAEARLSERNIMLSESQREKIADALIKAEGKGVKDALVMIDGFALVANAKSRTVITAVGENDLRQNIFTNIDGAVFA